MNPVGSPLLSVLARWRVGMGVALLSLAATLVYGIESSSHPLWLNPVLTAEAYDAWARQWIYGQGLPQEMFRQSFAYFLGVSALYFVSNASLVFVFLVQALAVAAACGVFAEWGRQEIHEKFGGLAGVLPALWPPLWFYTLDLGPAVWAFVGFAVAPTLLGWATRGVGLRRWLVVGAVGAGFSALHPALYAAGAGAALSSLFFRRGTRSPARGQRMAGLVGGFALVALPLSVVGLARAGVGSYAPAQDGLMLYLGNQVGDCSVQNPRPGPEWDRILRAARERGAHTLAEERAFFRRASGQDFYQRPQDWFLAGFRKAAQLANGREPGGDLTPYLARESSILARGLLWRAGSFGFPWGLFLPLALVGLIAAGLRLPPAFRAAAIAYAAAGILFQVTSGFRMGLLPAVSAGAVLGLLKIVDDLRNGRGLARVLWIAAAIGMAALFSLTGPFCRERVSYESAWRVALGQRAMARGQVDAGERWFEEALKLQPNQPVVYNGLAGVALSRGDTARAGQWLRSALAAAPDYALAWFNLALVQEALGQPQEAIHSFEQGLGYQSWRGQAHHDLARLLASQGAMDRALEHFALASELDPNVPPNYTAPAEWLLQRGQTETATALLKRATDRGLQDPLLSALIGQVEAGQGRYNQALGAFLIALDMNPEQPVAAYGMARVALAQGDLARARSFYASATARAPELASVWLTEAERTRLASAE